MAFPVRSVRHGKHRRPRRLGAGAVVAGVAVLAGGGTAGALAAAAPGQGAPTARDTLFSQVSGVPGLLAHSLTTQADAQRQAADRTASAAPQPSGTPAGAPKGTPAGTSKGASAGTSKSTAATPGAAASAPGPAAKARPSAGPRATSHPTSTSTTAPTSSASPQPAATKKPASTATGTTVNGWTAPVDGARVGTAYGSAGAQRSSGARSTGVDLLVPAGSAVHAVAAGTVVSVGRGGSHGGAPYGGDVVVRHADGVYTVYGGLSKVLVTVGQAVTEGGKIGVTGAAGGSNGSHLRFEVRTSPDRGSDIDPVAYLRSHGVDL